MIAAIDSARTALDGPPVSVPAARAGRTKEELQRTVSASRLATWLQCRLRFYFRYVVGIAKPTTPARHVGTVVHAVLQQWNLARWRRTPLDAEKVQAAFEQIWADCEVDDKIAWDEDEPEAAVKASAFGLIETYLRETPIPPEEKPEGVEVGVELDLRPRGLPILVGVLDLVRAGGRIVDYKTTGKTPNPVMALHTNEAQLTAYALLYREATGRRETGRELHHLVKTKTPKLVVVEDGPATATQITRFLRQVESYVRGVASEDFVPSPGFGCAACEFFNECRLHC
jgi:CRISPR/Cas system-associated exonuclease Cas4 (RecB family)